VIRTLTITAAIILFSAGSIFAEYVFLKDGSILGGKILNENPAGVTIHLETGKQQTIPRKDIIRILYTELYMGKVFVNKIDGTTVEAYMVDEDQKSYTFRKELNRPEEFVLKRDEVLFTARKNPVGLVGTAETDRVNISWKPPYTPIKYYKIYFKSGNEAFKLYGESGSTSASLKGLRGNVQYTIKVTAIDKEGDETLPSNEIKVSTLNSKPDAPKNLVLAKKIESDGTLTVTLTWDPAVDADGTVKEYKIFGKSTKDYEPAGATPKNFFEAKKLDANITHRFFIRAVDNKNEESENSSKVHSLIFKGYDISIQPLYIIPFGTFKKVHQYGYGAFINGMKKDFIWKNFDIGATTGYVQYKGAETDSGKVNSSFTIPLLATAEYRFEFHEIFAVIPRLALGLSYNKINYQAEPAYYTGYGLDQEKKDKSAIEPMLMGGVSVQCDVFDYWFARLGSEYGMMYEKAGMLQFATIDCAFGMKF
jgi:hypothetical protein